MTLVIALACKDGIVMASDGQATGMSSGGPIRQKCEKIFELHKGILLGASGTVGIIQRCRDAIREFAKEIVENGLNFILKEETSEGKFQEITIRDKIRQIIFSINKFEKERHKEFYGREEGYPVADILIAFFDPKDEKFKIWHVAHDGGEELLNEFGYGCSGIGDTFAYAFLKNFYSKDMDIGIGKLVAYRVLKEAIEIGAYGLGEPITIWIIEKDKTYKLTEEELRGLEDTVETWRKLEKEIFDNKKFVGEENETN